MCISSRCIYDYKSHIYYKSHICLLLLYIPHILIGNGYSLDRLTSPPNPPLLNSPLYRPYVRGYSTLSRMYTTTPSLPRLLRPATIRYTYIFIQCIYIHHLLHIFLHKSTPSNVINTILNLYLFLFLFLSAQGCV